MWIKCEDRLPETPKNWDEYLGDSKEYVVAYSDGFGGYSYQSMKWCDGWNCMMCTDGTISRKHEIKDIIAWFEIPEYKG